MMYEGSTNYETHVVSVWIAKDEVLYNRWSAIAVTLGDRLRLADALFASFESAVPALEGMWADLLDAGFSEIDWLDVADGLIEE